MKLLTAIVCAWTLFAQSPVIEEQMRRLRQMPDSERAVATKKLAIDIRRLPAGAGKVDQAAALANLSTEGDFGRDTLQEVTNTLAQSLREEPAGVYPGPYVELAQLARYEHMQVSMDVPQFAAAMAKLEADDRARQMADFTLTDLQGKTWTLRSLRGKVVVVNFWATWCPPCRKEIPDLGALYNRFKDRGLIILGISDEDVSKVKPFVDEQRIAYPVLLDPGRAVNDRFRIEGIPKNFVYDREGKLVAQSIDMRTEKQFLEMLAQAGLR